MYLTTTVSNVLLKMIPFIFQIEIVVLITTVNSAQATERMWWYYRPLSVRVRTQYSPLALMLLSPWNCNQRRACALRNKALNIGILEVEFPQL